MTLEINTILPAHRASNTIINIMAPIISLSAPSVKVPESIQLIVGLIIGLARTLKKDTWLKTGIAFVLQLFSHVPLGLVGKQVASAVVNVDIVPLENSWMGMKVKLDGKAIQIFPVEPEI